MTDASTEAPAKKRGLLLPVALVSLAAAAGFGTSYAGLWSPFDLPSHSAEAKSHDPAALADFAAVPPVQLSLTGTRARTLMLSAMIETEPGKLSDVEHLMPRVSDAFNGFLSEIDPAAFDKRGVLEIIRAELLNRTRFVVGENVVRDILITEFRLK